MSKINELVQKIEDKSLREELQQEVLRLKNRKKFGLVWEDKSEKVATDCEKHLPILREIDSLAIESSDSLSTNIIIEGDNYHALSVLNYTHFGAVDVIYIDPPYNTGARIGDTTTVMLMKMIALNILNGYHLWISVFVWQKTC